MGERETMVYVVADEHQRAQTLRNEVESAIKNTTRLNTKNIQNSVRTTLNGLNPLFVVDLTAVDKPAKSIIESIRETHDEPKVIALHLYKSSILVKPLYELGIDGYLHYKTTGDELTRAIKKVASGGQYFPPYIQPG